MGAVNKITFDSIKLDIKNGLQKQTIAKYYGLSYETVRKINNASSWRKWENNKKQKRIDNYKSIHDVELEYEEHSNWFMEKLRRFKKG